MTGCVLGCPWLSGAVRGCPGAGYLPQKFQQAIVGNSAQLLQKLAAIPEIHAEHNGQAENVLAVRQGIGYGLGNGFSKENYFLLMARGAEPAPLTGKGQQVVLVASITV